MTTPYANNFDRTKPFSDTCMSGKLAASTALSWTVPGVATNKYRAVFKSDYNEQIYIGYNVTAALPTSNTATTTPYQEMLPWDEPRYVKGGDVLSFISPGTPYFSAALLLVEQNP